MFIKLAPQSALPSLNEAAEFSCNGKMVCIANVNGKFAAMDNICTHHGGPLGQGVISKGKVVCPWHGWEFDPKTGQTPVPGEKIAVYPLKIEDGDVWIDLS